MVWVVWSDMHAGKRVFAFFPPVASPLTGPMIAAA